MDLDRRVRGTAYIGRIKTFDSHGSDDELYGVVHKGAGVVDFSLFKSICTNHNDRYFYSRKINKSSDSFTMRECLAAAKNYPMLGKRGISMLEHPMTFAEFGKLAYSKNILTSGSGFEELCADDVEEHTRDEKAGDSDVDPALSKANPLTSSVKSVHDHAASISAGAKQLIQGGVGTSQANCSKKLGHAFSNDDIPMVGEEVLEISETGCINYTVEALKERCALGDSKIEALEEDLEKEKNTVATLKAQLESLQEHNTKFMASNDLLESRSRAIRADNASEVVEGLKDELSLLKGLSAKLTIMSKSAGDQSAEQIEQLAAMNLGIDKINKTFSNSLASLESVVNKNNETLSKNVQNIWEVLADFGIRSDNPCIMNIPKVLSALTREKHNPVESKDASTQVSKSSEGCLAASTQTSSSLIGRSDSPTRPFSVPEGDRDRNTLASTRAGSASSRSRLTPSSADSRYSGSTGGLAPRRQPADERRKYQSLEYRPRSSGLCTDSPRDAGTFNVPHSNNNQQAHSRRVGVWENPPPVLKRSSEYSDESSRKRR